MFLVTHAANFYFLGCRKGRGSPTYPPALARRCQAFSGPLGNPFPLELGNGSKNMEHKTASRRRGVDVLSEGPEAGTAFADGLHNLQKVFKRPGQAVVLGLAGPKLHIWAPVGTNKEQSFG
tara:strand:+ start:214 stop:576 length:363 start_codon:yes stop_codon:yes gene_type:complete